MDWTSGYRADIDYTHGYYRELSTGLIDFALLQRGFEPPVRDGPVRYLELGFGQGVTLNIQAAASPGEYWGTDFNPAHANHAKGLARSSQADLRLFDDSFEELLHRDDLPQFDYIVLHGIWTWVSDENRRVIVDILRKHLKIGGVVYFSYNSLPGWASAMPLRHLLSMHVQAAGQQGDMVSRIDGAMAFATQLADSGAGYFTVNPYAKSRLDGLQTQSRNYLAHEYLNGVWTPMYFSEIQEWLTEAKLSYAAAASAMENIDGFVLTQPQRDIMASLSSDTLREGVRDYMLNTQFRRDLYVRGARRLNVIERTARIMQTRIVLLVPPDKLMREVTVGQNKVEFNASVYDPIIEALSANGGAPKRLSDLVKEPKIAALPPGAVIEAAQVLIGTGQASPVQEEPDIKAATPSSRRLNAAIVEPNAHSGEITVLASPVIGSGVNLNRVEQLLVRAVSRGGKTPQAWTEEVWNIFVSQNQALVHEGKPLATPEENMAELMRQALVFEAERLPVLKRLGIV
ncbi:MAG: hypothetical protein JWM33_3717 [Caulobacteraceae bacterium]|nr:hypothetical protein [Caulobacteraceae bacterium]